SLSSKPLPKVRYGFVDPIGLLSSASMARGCVVLLLIMHRQNLKRSFDKIQFVPAAAVARVVPHSNDERFRFATQRLIRNIPTSQKTSLHFGLSSPFRYSKARTCSG